MTPANTQQNAIFTEGACKGSRGRGGWAAVFYQDGKRRIVSGNDRSTTGNRMELTAAISGLQATPELQDVVILSDSEYLINTANKNWERTSNQDLWEQLDRIQQSRHVSWKWLSTRQQNPEKEIALRVAKMEAGLFGASEDNTSRRRYPALSGKPRHQGRPGNNRPGGTSRRSRRS